MESTYRVQFLYEAVWIHFVQMHLGKTWILPVSSFNHRRADWILSTCLGKLEGKLWIQTSCRLVTSCPRTSGWINGYSWFDFKDLFLFFFFFFFWLNSISRFKNTVYSSIYIAERKIWIHSFFKSISTKWKICVWDLNLVHCVHFLKR